MLEVPDEIEGRRKKEKPGRREEGRRKKEENGVPSGF